jgi:hypothetical protein
VDAAGGPAAMVAAELLDGIGRLARASVHEERAGEAAARGRDRQRADDVPGDPGTLEVVADAGRVGDPRGIG